MTKRTPGAPKNLKAGEYTDSMAGYHAISPDGRWWVHGEVVVVRTTDNVVVDCQFRTMTIEPLHGEREPAITSSVLRGLPIGKWLTAARRDVEETSRFRMEHLTPGSALYEQDRRTVEQMQRRPGRRGYPAEHWAQIALRYVQLDQEGERAISKRIAEEERVPLQTAKDWVSQARKRGYLTPAQPGRAGGAPGPELLRFLEESENEEANQ